MNEPIDTTSHDFITVAVPWTSNLSSLIMRLRTTHDRDMAISLAFGDNISLIIGMDYLKDFGGIEKFED